MTKTKQHWGILALCIATILIVASVQLHWFNNISGAAAIVSECETKKIGERAACFDSKILKAIDQNPDQTDTILTGLWKLSIDGKISEDARIFSDVAHEAGMLLAEKNIPLLRAFSWCGESFKQGCMHGVIMEYIDRNYPGEVESKKFQSLCKTFSNPLFKNNCLHGVGHELAAKGKKNLVSVLKLCQNIARDQIEKSACEGGVLMEFSKGTMGSGQHSHEAVGKMDLPCDKLPENFKMVCYGAAGSYRQYNPGEEKFSTTYNFCTSIPSSYIFQGMLGVSERVILATAENAGRALAICRDLSEDQQKMCLTSMIQVSKTQFANQSLTNTLEKSAL